MAGQEQVKKTKPEQPQAEEEKKKKKKPEERTKSVKDAADKLVDEIDETLDEQGLDFAEKYVQRGGE